MVSVRAVTHKWASTVFANGSADIREIKNTPVSFAAYIQHLNRIATSVKNMSKVLCVVKDIKTFNKAIIFGLVGDSSEDDSIDNDDHVTCYGCGTDVRICCAGNIVLAAREVTVGARIWVDQEELIDSIYNLPPN
jgi:uncharacterized protein YuzB (UPF0349 family)